MSEMLEAARKSRDKDGISGQMTIEMTDASKQLPQEIIPEKAMEPIPSISKGHKGKSLTERNAFVREGYAERISQLLENAAPSYLSMVRTVTGTGWWMI